MKFINFKNHDLKIKIKIIEESKNQNWYQKLNLPYFWINYILHVL
jgi:hypothetical protein